MSIFIRSLKLEILIEPMLFLPFKVVNLKDKGTEQNRKSVTVVYIYLFDSFQIAILLFVLLLWAGAISLFYHQWGKIRGIDDYQPDYVHANMTIQHNPIPEETSDKLVCKDFFSESIMLSRLNSPALNGWTIC